ncbi:MAG: cation transporter [Desulfamplus sp.]|nr:cation transporter [Desulfamplus sp.]MBF0388589.1 cation transporter [Desulfamplus sp.]
MILKFFAVLLISAIIIFAAFLYRGASQLEAENRAANGGKGGSCSGVSCQKCAQRVGVVNIIGNILMICIKGYMGVAGRSKGLIADAIHSSADLLATIIMIIGLRISDKKTDELYPYGYGKAEYIVSICIYLFLFGIGSFIIYNGIMTIVEGRLVNPCLSAAWGAIFSIAINELMFRQSICAGRHINSPSMQAKAWESRSDVYSSLAVLIGIIGAKMGFHFMDPLAAVIVGVIILKICVEQVKYAVLNLMDRAYDEDYIDDINKALQGMPNIAGIKKVIARELGPILEFEICLYVLPDISIKAGESIKQDAHNIVNEIVDRKSTVRVRLFAAQQIS